MWGFRTFIVYAPLQGEAARALSLLSQARTPPDLVILTKGFRTIQLEPSWRLCKERLNGGWKLGSISDDGHLVAGPQNHLVGRKQERIVSPDQNDPNALRERHLAERFAVGLGAARDKRDALDGAAACL